MLRRVARSSEKAPPGKRRRCSKGHKVKSRREPTGKQLRGVERGVSGPWRPARDWEAGKAAAAPAFARPRAARQGPPLTDASLPFRPGGQARGPAPAPTFGDLGFGRSAARRCLRPFASARGPGIPSLPDPPPRLPPAAFTCSESGWRASRPGPRRRVRDAAPRVRSPFPPPPLRSPARRWAGEQRRPRGGRVLGGETRAASAGRGDTAALCPAREEQPRRRQPREGGRAGGRPNGEGSREVGNGCHVVQVAHRPPPPPHHPAPRRDLWFVPELRHGASARPAGPAPETGPAGAPASPAPSGERVRAWPILPDRTRPCITTTTTKKLPRNPVSPFPGGAATGRSKPFSVCRVFGEGGSCFEPVNVISKGPQIFAEVKSAGNHGCF